MGDQYEQFYRNAGPRLGEWRDLGAKHKGNHILEIIGNRRCASLIEIGCGDGALLEYIHRQRPDIRLVGYEIADDPVERARRRGLEEIEVFDGSHVPTADDSFDIAILSHVLEHVPDPVGTLVEAGRIASTVVGEVPLEDTLASHRASYVPAAKVIGHIQKFSLNSARWLVERAGMRIDAEILTNKTREGRVFWATTPMDRAKANAKYFASRALEVTSPSLGRLMLASDYTFLCIKD